MCVYSVMDTVVLSLCYRCVIVVLLSCYRCVVVALLLCCCCVVVMLLLCYRCVVVVLLLLSASSHAERSSTCQKRLTSS